MIKLFLILLIFSTNVLSFTVKIKDTDLHVNGYVGYKYIHSNQKIDSINSEPELGLILSTEFNDNWSMYTQMKYDENIDHALVYSFVSYNRLLAEDLTFVAKVGRLRHETALYNDTRVNPRTRQGVIMPQGIYWDSLKYILTSGNGVNFNLTWKNLELTYTIDDPIVDDPITEAKQWYGPFMKKLDMVFGSHQLVTAKYTFDSIPLMFKTTYTKIDFGNQYTNVADFLYPTTKNRAKTTELVYGGFELNLTPFTISAESIMFKPFFAEWGDASNWSFGQSYTLKYELNGHINLYSNYNNYKGRMESHDVSIGVNYHRNKWMMSAEIHHINGGRWVDVESYNQNQDAYKEWYMIGVNAVYFF